MNEDILRMLGEVIESNIRQELERPKLSYSYAGKPKSSSSRGNSISSGRLLNSVTVNWCQTKDGNVRMSVEFPGAPEWYWVNNGRRGKQQQSTLKYPPLSVISSWTREKPIPQWRDKRGRFISYEDRDRLIQRSIGELGYRGTFFVDKGIQKSLQEIEVSFGIYGRTFIEEILERKVVLGRGTSTDKPTVKSC